jgi:membrane protein involved in colicin uptake
MSNPTKDQLLEQAKELGIEVPDDATKADIEGLLDEKAKADKAAAEADKKAADEKAKAEGKKAAPADSTRKRKEERRQIEEITERGDWLDPFSGKTVATGNEVNPINQVRREGDEAVLYG